MMAERIDHFEILESMPARRTAECHELRKAIDEGMRKWKERERNRHPLLSYYPGNQLTMTERGIMAITDVWLQPSPFPMFNIFVHPWGGVLTTAEVA
jgi:hypothetical protein